MRMWSGYIPDVEKAHARLSIMGSGEDSTGYSAVRPRIGKDTAVYTSPRMRMCIALHVLYMNPCLAGWRVFEYIPSSLVTFS